MFNTNTTKRLPLSIAAVMVVVSMSAAAGKTKAASLQELFEGSRAAEKPVTIYVAKELVTMSSTASGNAVASRMGASPGLDRSRRSKNASPKRSWTSATPTKSSHRG